MTPKLIATVAAGLDTSPKEVQTIPASAPIGDCLPDCPECNGAGYVRLEVAVGHPKFGKLERCPRAWALEHARSLQAGEVDPRVGLTLDELRHLSWDLVKRGVNQADRACEVTQRALRIPLRGGVSLRRLWAGQEFGAENCGGHGPERRQTGRVCKPGRHAG